MKRPEFELGQGCEIHRALEPTKIMFNQQLQAENCASPATSRSIW